MTLPVPLRRVTFRLCIAAMILTMVTEEFIGSTRDPAFSPVTFFSYFTIQSNLVAAVVLIIRSGGVSGWPQPHGQHQERRVRATN
jgi:uncharacterized membrane protein